jgi:drug/metabolite transporter (DMT)-like permease
MGASHLIGALLALTSALAWGAGDLSGGLATRRSNQFQVLTLSALSGVVVLAALAIARSESFPSMTSSIWASSAGVSGAFGLAALYYALSLGNAAKIAPIAAVISAGLPVLYGSFTEGLPNLARVIGFIAGILGIWLVSRSPKGSTKRSQNGILLAAFAGLNFGIFFILIAQVEIGAVFTPVVFAKGTSLCVALLILAARHEVFPPLRSNPIALLAGVLDAGGTVFFVLAKQFTRLDVAAVLASMYASMTVILARIFLKEIVSTIQWIGVVLCMIAIAFIVI